MSLYNTPSVVMSQYGAEMGTKVHAVWEIPKLVHSPMDAINECLCCPMTRTEQLRIQQQPKYHSTSRTSPDYHRNRDWVYTEFEIQDIRQIQKGIANCIYTVQWGKYQSLQKKTARLWVVQVSGYDNLSYKYCVCSKAKQG